MRPLLRYSAKPRKVCYVLLVIVVDCLACFAQGANKDRVIEVPFEFYQNEIIVQVKIDGKGPFNMMLDTGTDPSAIEVTTARELGLKLDAVGRPVSGGGTSKNVAYATKLPLVEVGGLAVRNVSALALDLSKVSEGLGKPLAGALGHSLLNGRVVQIDYPKRVVRFYPSSPLEKTTAQSNTAKLTVLPFRYEDNVLVDNVFVNGKKLVANIDTGSNGSFSLTPAAVAYLGLEREASRAAVSGSVGYNGMAENRKGKVTNVTVGGISVDSPAVTFFGKGTGRDRKPWGVNIGNEFFKDFVVTIDYRRKLIAFARPLN
jgi:predicted aspartyl protease